jgi:RimJ/RimL family protein N-acetyltransferase
MTTVAATPRLLLRRWEAGDAAITDGIYDDVETMRWFGDGRTFTREQVAKAIAGIIADYATHGYGNYAVVERESAAVIGHCGAHHVAGRDWVELDFALGKRWWGRGYATEAVAAVFLRCIRRMPPRSLCCESSACVREANSTHTGCSVCSTRSTKRASP